MASQDNFNLLCKEFGSSVSSTFKKLREDTDLTDVTLVCDDRQMIEAHKVILSSSSPLFRDMLKKIKYSQSHPMIFLRGIKSKYLVSLLDFIYRGEVNILQEDIADFFNVAENLEVTLLQAQNRDISKDFQTLKVEQENINSKENHIPDSYTNIMYDNDTKNNSLKESGKKNTIEDTLQVGDTLHLSHITTLEMTLTTMIRD